MSLLVKSLVEGGLEDSTHYPRMTKIIEDLDFLYFTCVNSYNRIPVLNIRESLVTEQEWL